MTFCGLKCYENGANLAIFSIFFTQCGNFRPGRRNQFWPRVPGGDLESRAVPPTAAHRGYNPGDNSSSTSDAQILILLWLLILHVLQIVGNPSVSEFSYWNKYIHTFFLCPGIQIVCSWCYGSLQQSSQKKRSKTTRHQVTPIPPQLKLLWTASQNR